jgi:hypothetical protein
MVMVPRLLGRQRLSREKGLEMRLTETVGCAVVGATVGQTGTFEHYYRNIPHRLGRLERERKISKHRLHFSILYIQDLLIPPTSKTCLFVVGVCKWWLTTQTAHTV